MCVHETLVISTVPFAEPCGPDTEGVMGYAKYTSTVSQGGLFHWKSYVEPAAREETVPIFFLLIVDIKPVPFLSHSSGWRQHAPLAEHAHHVPFVHVEHDLRRGPAAVHDEGRRERNGGGVTSL